MKHSPKSPARHFVRVFVGLFCLFILSIFFQNCGGLSAGGEIVRMNAATGESGPISSPAQFLAMKENGTYELASDIDLRGQIVDHKFDSVTLDGKGHAVRGFLAECTADGDCQANAGRENYISALAFDKSSISNVTFEIQGDISKFPAVTKDITAISFLNVSNSVSTNVSLVAKLRGTRVRVDCNS